MTNEVGRPTVLDDEMYLKIRKLVLEGKEMTEISTELDIPYKTMDSWVTRNYQGFRERMDAFKREKMLRMAEFNLVDMMEMDTQNIGVTKKGDEFVFNDPRLVKVKADVSMFVAETVGKSNYSKRSEGIVLGEQRHYIIARGSENKDDQTGPIQGSVSALASEADQRVEP